ncbi:MAG: UDP-N-acetylmuramoylalanyl-D-glutamyl-2,6-diaminopimelate--D-alanyl-D-alanine ligase [Pseudomonadota bacterium]
MTRKALKPAILWTAKEVIQAVQGHVNPDLAHQAWEATGVSIDSRTIKRGELFLALEGENFDGHDYVADAFVRGAAAAIISRVPDNVPEDWALVVVDDTYEALEDLAGVARHRNQGTMVALTGSVGKTGTKEALRLCLGAQGPAFASEGNLNNHIGAPLTLSRMPTDSFYNVFELGMNHAGEIEPLAKMVQPDIAIITNVHEVHIENFEDEEGIADAKAEIFAGLSPNGTAIINADNRHYARLLAHAKTRGIKNILTFGSDRGTDAYIVDAQCHATSSAISAVVNGERLIYSLSVPGKHWVLNSLAVLLAVSAAGADVPTAARALSYLKPVKGRGSRSLVSTAFGAFTLIDESYNASPTAMRAAFAVLDKTDPQPGGRRIAVLGDMLELGDHATSAHAGLARDLRKAGIETVHCSGPMMRHLYDALPHEMRGHYAPDAATLAPLVANDITGGDVVLVKGSNGSKMKAVVEELTALSDEEQVYHNSTALAVNDG